jgi:S1-C subfamily serine protease
MKTKNIITTIALVLVWSGTGLTADTDSTVERPYIGVMLDAMPLPDLLVKHLNLEPGQGIRIANIHRDSPADKAGLERDDIIIGFEGKNVDDRQQFVDNVRKAGIGTEV